MRAIVAQQVSAASARAIWGRLEAAVQPLDPAGLLALGDEQIRACGFSRQKIAYARGLAEAIVCGSLDLDRLASAPDDEALAALIALKGIGRWSAEVYLLFALGRTDIFSSQDLALAIAVQKIRDLPARPKPKELAAIAEDWRPWRSIAAVLLWHYYRSAP